MNDSTETQTSAYIWFDTEYTTVDLGQARLLQVAAIATDSELNRLLPPEEDPVFYVKLREGTDVSPWVQQNLSEVIRICKSDRALELAQIDALLIEWLGRVSGPSPGNGKSRPVLAGNSIHADWFMIRKHLPEFMGRLHYRLLDVTTLKLIWRDWLGGKPFDKADEALVTQYLPGAAGAKGKPHDAYYDVQASIAELNFYRSNMLKNMKHGEPNPAPALS